MLITFKTSAAPDVMMLENLAEYLLGTLYQEDESAAPEAVRWFRAAAEQGNLYAAFPGERFSHFRKTGGYANLPLDGIWLRAPYLHNGSVPTLRDLLEPAAKRPALFYRGYDVYDPAKVGFVTSKAVGPAVVRNRVRRRLRHVMAERLRVLPPGALVVVRALPASAGASSRELAADLDRALTRLVGAP